MSVFKKYQRKEKAELRPVSEQDINCFKDNGMIPLKKGTGMLDDILNHVSISHEDLKNGSPKIGDMIARNPKNHNDQWLVSELYFSENFDKVN